MKPSLTAFRIIMNEGLEVWVNADTEPPDAQHRREELVLLVNTLNRRKIISE
jgi:hypothetical protein